MFRKVALLEILRSPLLPRIAGLQYTFCNATKNELLTKFHEGAFKLTENFQEVISWVSLSEIYRVSALLVVKIPEITSTVQFLSLGAGAKQQLKPPRKT